MRQSISWFTENYFLAFFCSLLKSQESAKLYSSYSFTKFPEKPAKPECDLGSLIISSFK